jgi:GNAT superfamily N-acetyltransferase
MTVHPVTDLALSRRLERAEGRSNAAFVAARARLQPHSGATWQEIGEALAMFDGVGSPLTQTFALGLAGDVDDAALDAIEAFFAGRGADVCHEVSPMADVTLLERLPARGYRPVELTTILHLPLAADVRPAAERPADPALRVRPIDVSEAAHWADVSARGWGETPELADFMRGFGTITAQAEGTVCFLAEWEGTPVGTGAMGVHGGVALLAGASTLPPWRGRGAQGALLGARLRHAAALGCDVAMMGALPGSASQRNAERQGFRIAYTRMKWYRAHAARAHAA